jgi:hypothetical protein
MLHEQAPSHECGGCKSSRVVQPCCGAALAPPRYGIALADAQHGIASSSVALPHLERIQASFGSSFDVSTIRAHVGPTAAQATRRMGTQGYAMGEHVVFRGQPSLRVAAHEAAHVMQQRRGVQLSGGVGTRGDAYERHAEEVAERVVAGDSAESLLESAPGPAVAPTHGSVAVQQLKDKEVSNTALVRLQMAKGAMAMTKSVLKHGAGNQIKALQSSKLNSLYRLRLARNVIYWDVDPAVNDLITADPGAYHGARAFVASGGNCGEHGRISYEFLKTLAKGQRITLAAKQGLDHAFVLIGDLSEADGTPKEPDTEIAVADAWPTSPTATIWDDHFAYTPKRSEIEKTASTVANGQSSMMAIAAGIKLNSKGLELLNKTGSDEEVAAKVARYEEDHLWDHEKSAAKDKEFTYFTKDAMDRRVDLK